MPNARKGSIKIAHAGELDPGWRGGVQNVRLRDASTWLSLARATASKVC